MKTSVLLVVCLSMIVASTQAFTCNNNNRPSFVGVSSSSSSSSSRRTQLQAVVDIGSESAFDKTIKDAGDSLVIVDYSTTWCGPCKVIAPKFEELSEKYTDVVFLKVIGDASAEASKLMKREGVRSVPSFHYFLKGEKVDVVNGANAEAIEAAISKFVKV